MLPIIAEQSTYMVYVKYPIIYQLKIYRCRPLTLNCTSYFQRYKSILGELSQFTPNKSYRKRIYLVNPLRTVYQIDIKTRKFVT